MKYLYKLLFTLFVAGAIYFLCSKIHYLMVMAMILLVSPFLQKYMIFEDLWNWLFKY